MKLKIGDSEEVDVPVKIPSTVSMVCVNGVPVGEPVQVREGDTIILTKDDCVEVGRADHNDDEEDWQWNSRVK